MTSTVEEIVSAEWALFDQVHNLGGRAACQDDEVTFIMMRSSQLMTWSPDLQESYLQDIRAAMAAGRNLLSEKYAYMMERTASDEYKKISDQLPPRMLTKDILIEQICAAHVAWLESLAKRYPRLTGRGRPIRKSADSPGITSFETYLWGELATYSMRTVQLYAAYVEKLKREGRNLNEMILQNMIRQYGDASLEAAEARLSGT